MTPPTFMVVAGEASGDLLAAELVSALRIAGGVAPGASAPRFFGAGGQHLVDAGVDFSGFNRRLAHAIRRRQSAAPGWRPRIIQFVSPQVWASRPGRAQLMARDFDLLLSIFPFEKAWYAEHAPGLRVEFVGHPMIDRHAAIRSARAPAGPIPSIVLLPGSREGELRRHLPVMLDAAAIIRSAQEAAFRLVVAHHDLLPLARELAGGRQGVELQVGGLPDALGAATLALAATGTVTMECALFGVPTVTMYKTNWLTYQVARRIVTVKSLTMPNLLAGEPIYPEFIQRDATPARLAQGVLDLLTSSERRIRMQDQLATVVDSLGAAGACRRAADGIWELVGSSMPAPASSTR